MVQGPAGFDAYARVLDVPDPRFEGQPEDDIDDGALDAMPDTPELFAAVADILVPLTSTPDDLRFLLWEGWPYEPALPNGPRFDIYGMSACALASGAFEDWFGWTESGPNRGYPPAFVWPEDRAWCLAYDVDSHFLGIGGAADAIARVLAQSPDVPSHLPLIRPVSKSPTARASRFAASGERLTATR